MAMNRWLIFAAGILVGVVAARFLLQNPKGRRVAKRVIKAGLATGGWLATQIQTLREDVSDLVAEAREERQAERPAA